MAERITLTCDYNVNRKVCGREAHTYTMTGPDGTWSMDLCDKHDGAYTDFQQRGRLAKQHRTPGRRTVQDMARPFIETR